MTLAAVTLQLGDYAVMGGMLAGTATVTTVLMLANVKGLGRRVDVVEGRVADVEKRKADKFEWARENLLARRKMDAVATQLAGLDAKLDASVGVAANVGRLVEELSRWRRENPRD